MPYSMSSPLAQLACMPCRCDCAACCSQRIYYSCTVPYYARVLYSYTESYRIKPADRDCYSLLGPAVGVCLGTGGSCCSAQSFRSIGIGRTSKKRPLQQPMHLGGQTCPVALDGWLIRRLRFITWHHRRSVVHRITSISGKPHSI